MKLKRLVLAAAIGVASLQIAGSQAASSSSQFDVTINLTSACTFGAIAPVTFTYVSLGGAVSSGGGTFNVTCTNTLPYTTGLSAGATAGPGGATLDVTDTATNLAYQLTSPAGGPGTGLSQPKTISGTMAAGQAGTCGAASCDNTGSPTANKRHTVYFTF
jgi:spore coat protein U-like protein